MNHPKREKFVMGNWKMNGSQETIHALLTHIKSILIPNNERQQKHIVVFPAFVHLAKTAWMLRQTCLEWGGQNVSAYERGAYTGEISAEMLKDVDCRYVLVGHSERRQYFNETNSIIARKIFASVKAGIRPVLCVGETREDYEAKKTKEKVWAQLDPVLKCENVYPFLSSLMIAYEPVWAIGSGLTASPQHAQDVHKFIREIFADISDSLAGQIPIIYGGSVTAKNIAQIFAMPDIDGCLVGGASLRGEEFQAICHAMLAEPLYG